MHLSAPFIQRPVATSLLSLALLLAGSVAYSLLPVASLPDVDFPVIGVGAGLPGASPETMASAVATPLERQFGRIAGVNQMTSSSSLGSASVSMQFDINPEWPIFVTYAGPGAAKPTLDVPNPNQIPGRFLYTSTKDFFAVFLSRSPGEAQPW